MFIIRPAAEIEPQVSIASSKRILPGPMRSSASRSMRIFSDGDDCGVGAMLLVSEGCKEVALPALAVPGWIGRMTELKCSPFAPFSISQRHPNAAAAKEPRLRGGLGQGPSWERRWVRRKHGRERNQCELRAADRRVANC